MVTPLAVRGVSELIYDYQLSSSYKSPWVYDPSFALKQEPDIWEVVRNDVVFASAIQRRTQSIVRPWRVVPNRFAVVKGQDPKQADDSKRVASICHEGLSRIDRFDAARRHLADGYFVARTYAAILWQEAYCSLDGTAPMLWHLPMKLHDIDRRRIHWVPEWAPSADGTTRKTGIHLEMFNTDTFAWERISDDQRRNMIEYIYDDIESRIGHGRGALEGIYFYHYFKSGTFKKITEAIDRYANGVLIGTVDSLRNASVSKTNADLLNAMKSLLQNFRSEHVIVLNDGDKIELVEPTGTGVNISMDFVRYLDDAVERLCNGSVRPSGGDAGGTGARAQAETEADTSEAFFQDDRDDLDSIIDRDLLGAFLYHNQENFALLGLDGAKRPKFTSEQITRQDPEREIRIMGEAVKHGAPILQSALR